MPSPDDKPTDNLVDRVTNAENRIATLKQRLDAVAEDFNNARDAVMRDLAAIRSDGQRQLDELLAAVKDLRAHPPK